MTFFMNDFYTPAPGQTQLDNSATIPYFYIVFSEDEKPVSTPTPTATSFTYPEDKFRKGRIIKFFPHAGYGFVRDLGGKEVYFHLDEVRFVGEKGDRRYVSEGAPVGFDVGRTSRGLRVTFLKLY